MNFLIYCANVTGHKIFISGREFILCACDVGAVWHLTLHKISPSQDPVSDIR